jgi:hypothetical protein
VPSLCRRQNPTYRISDSPDSDANTSRGIHTCLGHRGVVCSGRSLDVQLCDGDLLDARGGEGLEGAGDVAPLAGAQVGLAADAVDGHAGRDPLLDVRDHARGQLGVRGRVEVVVVDVQHGVRVGLARGLEGDAYKVLAKHVGKDRGAEGAVLIEDLVDNVLCVFVTTSPSHCPTATSCNERKTTKGRRISYPGPNLSLVSRDQGSNMVLKDAGQLGLVLDVADPAGQLAVPAQGVTADGLVVRGSPIDEIVAAGEVEVALRGLRGVPFHAVLGGNLPEVRLNHGRRLPRCQAVLVRTGPVVDLALGFDKLVDGRGGLPLRQLCGGSCQGGEGREEE